ncbi:MAG: M23 family metallopeptidase [bacterium]|nr:M23 family metallopeptidase [bacterium]
MKFFLILAALFLAIILIGLWWNPSFVSFFRPVNEDILPLSASLADSAGAVTSSVLSSSTPITATSSLFEIWFRPGNLVYQGEAVAVIANKSNLANSIIFQEKEYPFFIFNNEKIAVIGLGAKQKTGSAILKIGDREEKLEILEGVFGSEKVPAPKPLSAVQAKQRVQERATVLEEIKVSSPAIYFDKPFVLPLSKIEVTEAFGFQRISPVATSIHNGVDLRAAVGVSVMAINAGRVLMADKYLYEGGFVILDHGNGIQSTYLHLSKVNVKEGQIVERGEIIGLSGSSGLSTGPHLHFGVKIYEVDVDPLRFLDLWD